MKCEKALKMMSLYLDHELDPVSEKKLLAHIAKCKSCKKEMKELKQLLKGIAEVPLIDLPIGYHEELMGKIKNTMLDNVEVLPQKRKSLWKNYGIIAAAFLLVIMAGGGIGKIMGENQNRLYLNETKKEGVADEESTEIAMQSLVEMPKEEKEKSSILVRVEPKEEVVQKKTAQKASPVTNQKTTEKMTDSVQQPVQETTEQDLMNSAEIPVPKEGKSKAKEPFCMMAASQENYAVEEEPLIKHLFVDLVVKDMDKATESIYKKAVELDGSVLEQLGQGVRSGGSNIVLKIPSSRYEEAADVFTHLGVPITKQETMEISEYQQILAERQTVQQNEQELLLRIEQNPSESLKKELDSVRKNLAVYEKQLEAWEDKAEYTIITIHFAE